MIVEKKLARSNLQFQFTIQEEADAALNDIEEEPEEPEVVAQESDSEAESDDQFGVGQTAPEKPAPTKRERKAANKAQEAVEQGPTPKPDAPKRDSRKGSENDKIKVEKLITKADTMLQAVKSYYSPLGFWQGTCKEEQLETKLKKAMAAVEALGPFEGAHPQAKSFLNESKDYMSTVGKQVDTLGSAGSFRDPNTNIFEFVEGLDSVLKDMTELPANCNVQILTDWGAALIKVGLLQQLFNSFIWVGPFGLELRKCSFPILSTLNFSEIQSNPLFAN